MSGGKVLLIAVFAAFAAYSSWVLLNFGYLGLWQAALVNDATIQVLVDLVIVCLLFCNWMVADARRSGRNPWPFVGLTLAAGSFGPLLYLIMAPGPATRTAVADS